MCYGLMEPKLNVVEQDYSSPKEHNDNSEAWWWQHPALGLFFQLELGP